MAAPFPTIQQALHDIARRLGDAGIPSAPLEAAMLVATVTGWPRLNLFLHRDEPLTEARLQRLEELVRRRCQRIPIQHLIGSVGFLDLDLEVGPAALIPRPETEGLVIAAFSRVIARPSDPSRPRHWLDLGTGTGCIALALAWKARQQGLTGVHITGMDLSPTALDLARRNAVRNRLDGHVDWMEHDLLDFLEQPTGPLAGHPLELIVSNPPYIPTDDIAGLDPEVRDHDPRSALDGGADGLVFLRALLSRAHRLLADGGWLALEFGDGQTASLLECVARNPAWGEPVIEKDLSGKDRVLMVPNRRPQGQG
jgi:release factor glutamine methyltransferase